MFQIRASPLGPVCVQNGGAVKLRYGGPICFCSKLGFRTYWAKTGRSNSKATRNTPITTALGGLLRGTAATNRSEEHTSELQSLRHHVCRLLLEKKQN